MLNKFDAEKKINDMYSNINLKVENQVRGETMQGLAGQILQLKPDLTACMAYANNIALFNKHLDLLIAKTSTVAESKATLAFLDEKLEEYKQDPAKPEYIDPKVFAKAIMTLETHFARLAMAEKAAAKAATSPAPKV